MGSVLKPLVAGNWKMNGTRDSLAQIEETAASKVLGADKLEALICLPATLLHAAAVIAGGTSLQIGAQDCHHQEGVAYTGDISASPTGELVAGWRNRRKNRQCL